MSFYKVYVFEKNYDKFVEINYIDLIHDAEWMLLYYSFWFSLKLDTLNDIKKQSLKQKFSR